MLIKVNPLFSEKQSMLLIPQTELNYFTREKIVDNINRYQRDFGVFGYMQLDSRNKFTITTLRGTPFMWQPVSHCTWTPTGNLYVTKESITPTEAQLKEEFCHDELVNSMFKEFISTNNKGLSAEGNRLFLEVVQKVTEQATIGAWLTLTVGQSYDLSTVSFANGTDATVQSLFRKTIGTVKGWVELFRGLAAQDVAKYGHLNVPNLFAAENFTGDKYTGDAVELFDSLYEAAPAELRSVIDTGTSALQTGSGQPLYIVTPSVHAQVVAAKKLQDAQVLVNKVRITTQKDKGYTVYYIDDVPVIPISYISELDVYVKQKFHFASIVLSGNIQLGTSFAALPEIGKGVGLAMQAKTDLDELGRVLMRADSMFATSLADYRYAVATQTQVVSA